jgi:AhpC/TSA family
VKGNVKLGRKAPEFSLESDSGERMSLEKLRGRPVVLYFYPIDNAWDLVAGVAVTHRARTVAGEPPAQPPDE